MQADMSLTALVVCADSRSAQLLEKILAELGLRAESCADLASARERLAESFDAVLVDCYDEQKAGELIDYVRNASVNRVALVVGLVDSSNNVRSIFARGANFILYKPISAERAATSLRAARFLMRRERRQSQRIPVHAPATIACASADNLPATLLDLSESGVSIQCERKLPPACKVYFQFSLPGQVSVVRLAGEIVWQDSTGRVGIRFAAVPQASRKILSEWLLSNVSRTVLDPSVIGSKAPAGLGLTSVSGADRRGRSRHACHLGADIFRLGSSVPFRCSLSDISNGGCYVETTEPFSAMTAIEIIVRTPEMKLRLRGTVQATHPGFGMGVKFSVQTAEQREQVQKLVALVAQNEAVDENTPAEPWKG